MVRIKHTNDVAHCLVYFVRCDCRGFCKFDEVYGYVLVGCVLCLRRLAGIGLLGFYGWGKGMGSVPV